MQLTKSKSTGSKQLWTGIGSFTVLAINPTKEQVAEIMGYEMKEDAKEREYEGKSKGGDEMVTILFLLQADIAEKPIVERRFNLVDKESFSEKSKKTQWVNQVGMATWVDDEKNLPVWFTHFTDKDKNKTGEKIYREAIQGEAEFYEFMRCWLGEVSFFANDTNILIDKKKAFRNIDKYVDSEFRPLLTATGDDKLITDVVAMSTVYTAEKDGELKHYQNIGHFLPSKIKDAGKYGVPTMSVIRICASTNNWNSNDIIKKYVQQITGEYGIKDAYTLSTMQPFEASQHQNATNTTFKQDSDDSSTGSDTADDTSY